MLWFVITSSWKFVVVLSAPQCFLVALAVLQRFAVCLDASRKFVVRLTASRKSAVIINRFAEVCQWDGLLMGIGLMGIGESLKISTASSPTLTVYKLYPGHTCAKRLIHCNALPRSD